MSDATVKSSDFVHRFVPASKPEAAVTLLLLHGTGGSEADLLPLGQALLPGANLLSLRGKVLENGMPRFFRRLAEGVFDQADLKFRTGEMAAFLAEAAIHYGFDAKRIIAVGYSNGANIAASLLLRQPEKLAGAVLFHPMVPFVPETLPDLSGKPIFIGAGRNDPIVPVVNTEELAALFEKAGAEVTQQWHRGGHSLTQEEVQAAQIWLQQRRPA
ncbi:MAG: Glyoxalase/bleomycin resistance protein/dioxygenase [Chthonomonadaceae bacterium]|nr:Glyoxalase/bleomycin resistance protein/dioxygenase [Chthonomonadaceae bacterium]